MEFFLSVMDFFSGVSWSTPYSSLSYPRCHLQTLFFPVYYGFNFFLAFTPGHLCIRPVCSE